MYRNKKSVLLKFSAVLMIVSILCTALLSCGKSVSVPVGNSINYGYALVDGVDFYYSKTVINGGDYYSCIYKYNMSTGEDVLVSMVDGEDSNIMNAYLTLDKGNLYFLTNYLHESYLEAAIDISYVKPDENTPENVSTIFDEDISCRYMQIIDGVIYYYDDWEEMIYRVNTDGSDKKAICEAAIMSDSIMCVDGKKIYYGEDTMIYQVGTGGGTPKVIFDSEQVYEDDYFYIGYLMADKNYIYYMDDYKTFIGRMSANGKNDEVLYTAPETSYIESFNVSDGVVYFVLDTDDTYEIMSITPGSSTPKVIVDRNNYYAEILPVSIWGDNIYYLALPAYETIMDSDYVWFTVKKSGGNVSPIRPFTVESDTFGYEEEWDEDADWEEDDDAESEE